MRQPKPGEVYRSLESETSSYQILMIAKDFDNIKRKFVIMEQLHESPRFKKGTIWAISLEDFNAKEVIKDHVYIEEQHFRKGTELFRFLKIS